MTSQACCKFDVATELIISVAITWIAVIDVLICFNMAIRELSLTGFQT